ncbi:hypothetical protein HM1_0635 [Heliomicrobium modesticaldum Ice1]|jgi:hypothetical protein|uniref:Uncharacterized protein n=1 Tax=Heliobacterium modesticaldum (strain ATCC 51547 / Ice1) TaxID=498761 RepID=B0TGH9_HELMI|nr:hypothetical protein [Heliomicrobium modesticaldum]ABZ83240.1 hypothetical protein HM1_0635 [Heliomicrobium modesticaldum Ice1]
MEKKTVEKGCKYPAIEIKKKTGNEQFLNAGSDVCTLRDFWAWAYSDLIGNTERGRLAEFIVAMALGITEGISVSWDKYDLLSKEGIRVEVKTSAYLQSWSQQNLSKISFGIQPTYGWDSVTNEYDAEKKRQSDVYVFCILKHKEQATLNPLDLLQWDFYVLSTAVLNKTAPGQKTISLRSLMDKGAKQCEYAMLYETIKSEAAR